MLAECLFNPNPYRTIFDVWCGDPLLQELSCDSPAQRRRQARVPGRLVLVAVSRAWGTSLGRGLPVSGPAATSSQTLAL
jgi:hypothetical protein